jgi:hypothetical protein
MTLAKFHAVMEQTELESTYFEINRNDRLIARALNILSRLPGLKEYFAFSIHSVWEHRRE